MKELGLYPSDVFHQVNSRLRTRPLEHLADDVRGSGIVRLGLSLLLLQEPHEQPWPDRLSARVVGQSNLLPDAADTQPSWKWRFR